MEVNQLLSLLFIRFLIIMIIGIFAIFVIYFYINKRGIFAGQDSSSQEIIKEGFVIIDNDPKYEFNKPLDKDNIPYTPQGYYSISNTKMKKLPSNVDEISTTLPNDYDVISKNFPRGYYILTDNNTKVDYVAKIPYGFKLENDDPRKIVPVTTVNKFASLVDKQEFSDNKNEMKYNPSDIDVSYNNSSDLLIDNKYVDTSFSFVLVKSPNGELVSLPYVPGTALPTYYHPGSLMYPSSNYVPKYEDSIYLSRSTGMWTTANARPTSSSLRGFCGDLHNNPEKLEEKCNSLSNDVCGSTECCVLLGGEKCVSGNEKGPIMRANYTDETLYNKDKYYYRGMCYGNC